MITFRPRVHSVGRLLAVCSGASLSGRSAAQRLRRARRQNAAAWLAHTWNSPLGPYSLDCRLIGWCSVPGGSRGLWDVHGKWRAVYLCSQPTLWSGEDWQWIQQHRDGASSALLIYCTWSEWAVLWRCWLGGRKGIRPVKTEWWGAGMVICLDQGADLHMAQLMRLPLSLAPVKSRLVLPFWYRPTRVVLEKGLLNGVCVWSEWCPCSMVSSLRTTNGYHVWVIIDHGRYLRSIIRFYHKIILSVLCDRLKIMTYSVLSFS